MLIKIIILSLALFIVALKHSSSADYEWYIPEDIPEKLLNEVTYSIAVSNSNSIWFSSRGNGLFRYSFGYWRAFNSANSGLPDNDLVEVYFDKNNDLYCATYEGIAKFDGNNWTVWNSKNTIIKDNRLVSSCIDSGGGLWASNDEAIYYFKDTIQKEYTYEELDLKGIPIRNLLTDKDNNIWFGTLSFGLYKFDWDQWRLYYYKDLDPEGCPFPGTRAMTMDFMGQLWITPNCGIAKYEGEKFKSWTMYNSDIPNDYINCMAADRENNLWLGTMDGLIKFDGETFTQYNTSNSPIPTDDVYAIAIDSMDHKWISCYNYSNENDIRTRIAVFREGGTIFSDVEDKIIEESFRIYPNPATDKITLDINLNQIENFELSIYNCLGTKVKTIQNKTIQPGSFAKTIDISGLASGSYLARLELSDRIISEKLFILK